MKLVADNDKMDCARRPWLPAHDLLRDVAYRRLWTSILISSFGGQVTMLALPLTAAVLLHASPTQMGLLTAMEMVPFVLFSLPAGVWLDRVRKLPVYIAGEMHARRGGRQRAARLVAGWLSIGWLYVCGFVIGTVYTIAGSAAQIVLTQVVARERLVEAHAKNALAASGAEVAGPGLAGALIKVVGAPLALLVDAVMLTVSAAILRGVAVHETPRARVGEGSPTAQFWRRSQGRRALRRAPPAAGRAGAGRRRLAGVPPGGDWSSRSCSRRAPSASREQAIGLSYTGMGVGTIVASVFGNRISRRIGPGPVPGARLRRLRRRLAAARGRAGQRLGRRGVRADADDVLDRRGA